MHHSRAWARGGSPWGWSGRFDWIKLQQIAYGPLELKPDQFWALTPGEFMALCEGYRSRRKVRNTRDAWLLANLLQPYSPKKKLTVEMFLKNVQQSESGQTTSKVSEEEFQELMRKHPQLALQRMMPHGGDR